MKNFLTSPSRRRSDLAVRLAIGMQILAPLASAQQAPSPATAEPATPSAMTTPAMTGPLTANPTPMTVDLGPLGKPYFTGVISGLGFTQNHAVPADRTDRIDLSNAQVFVQKTDGVFQYFLQVGDYSLPALGTAYLSSGKTVNSFYGSVPQAYIKIVPSSNFSVLLGKLPTLLGAEYTFTFENMNIQRGLLWNQENAVNRGIQANYAHGLIAVAVSWNDGFYSGHYNWLVGSLAYTFNAANVLSIVAGGNLGQTSKTSLATPLFQNNQDIYNVIYTHTTGPWIVQPYLQYTTIPTAPEIGIDRSASTFGAGLLANYAFTPHMSLAGRVEYIGSSGNADDGAPNLMYGSGSKAWSMTLTPTYQNQRFFARGELSYTKASSVVAGAAFGRDGTHSAQTRLLMEVGLLF